MVPIQLQWYRYNQITVALWGVVNIGLRAHSFTVKKFHCQLIICVRLPTLGPTEKTLRAVAENLIGGNETGK